MEEIMMKWPAVVGLALAAVLPVNLHAQVAPATHCGDPEWFCGAEPDSHYLCGDLFDHTYHNEHCVECLVCDLSWSFCHPACSPELADGADGEAYQEIMRVAAAGDVSSVIALAPKARDYVSFNRERWAIQILDCRKEAVVANLPLQGKRFAVSDLLALTRLR